ncbi:MAG: hypothetical protein JWO62_110 [Acidimicrobiaceae bacterium]|jgi:hypothetical protein|nr:hypothetical protein [Acidimicrobiaceae bacterium]
MRGLVDNLDIALQEIFGSHPANRAASLRAIDALR